MAKKGFDWFVGEFLPSLEKRMDNPKYPNTCILSALQAEVCYKYMESIQCKSDYGWFYVYELKVGNKAYQMKKVGRYIFLSVTDLDRLAKIEEEKHRKDLIDELVKHTSWQRETLEAMDTAEIEKVFDREFDLD